MRGASQLSARSCMPSWYYYYRNSVYIYPPPLHTWRLILTYEPREETRTRNALGEFTGASKSEL